ncbi:hypothetical protein ACIBG7_27300 [Nonomuraea sp. NPDC050328]|uniref:hypothetical protein n=1 Tax=Nonomuraea sp. NPDC050328 TaxID=3364361 RepID=UPI00379B6A9C
MTEPTTNSASSTSSAASKPANPARHEPTVRREAQDPARAHLPLTVWLTPADSECASTCRPGCCLPVSGPLARHLISACTRLGETVIHLGATDHQVVSAALTAGCLPVAVFSSAERAGVSWTRLARTHPDHDLEVTDLRITDPHDHGAPVTADLTDRARLVVAEQTCQQHLVSSDCQPALEAEGFDVVQAAHLLRPGGHLAVVTGLHRTDHVIDPLPEIIAMARRAGLVYLQHIIALHQPARGDHLDPRLPGHHLSARRPAGAQQMPACAWLPWSPRAHSDVLLFTRPSGGHSKPYAPQTPPPGSAQSPIDARPTAQTGSAR